MLINAVFYYYLLEHVYPTFANNFLIYHKSEN